MALSKIAQKMRKCAVQNFMDILLLTEMEKGSLSGYNVIRLIHQQFGIVVSSDTIYSLLYSLERDGWVSDVWSKRKRVYSLTKKGERNISRVSQGGKINYRLH